MKNCNAFWLGEAGRLFGIRHVSADVSGKVGVVILNAGLLHHVGPFRLHVLLAEQFADAGFPVIRLDQSGKGESARRKGVRRNDSILMDYDEAVSNLELLGVQKFVVVGLCSGADDGLFIAANRDNVAGLVMLDGYAQRNLRFHVTYYFQRIFSLGVLRRVFKKISGLFRKQRQVDTDGAGLDIRDWADDAEMIRRLVTLLEREGTLLAVFTDGQDYYNYLGQLSDNLSVAGTSSSVDEIYFRGVDHTFTTEHHRDLLVTKLTDWMRKTF